MVHIAPTTWPHLVGGKVPPPTSRARASDKGIPPQRNADQEGRSGCVPPHRVFRNINFLTPKIAQNAPPPMAKTDRKMAITQTQSAGKTEKHAFGQAFQRLLGCCFIFEAFWKKNRFFLSQKTSQKKTPQNDQLGTKTSQNTGQCLGSRVCFATFRL